MTPQEKAEHVKSVKAAWYAANREKSLAANKAWREANRERNALRKAETRARNKAAEKATAKAYYDQNREARLAKARDWYARNRARVAARRADWNRANSHLCAASTRKRDAQKLRAMPAWANEKKIAEIYAEAVGQSRLTGIPHHVDHIVPLQGKTVCGLHWEGNLRVVTAAENLSKHNRLVI